MQQHKVDFYKLNIVTEFVPENTPQNLTKSSHTLERIEILCILLTSLHIVKEFVIFFGFVSVFLIHICFLGIIYTIWLLFCNFCCNITNSK